MNVTLHLGDWLMIQKTYRAIRHDIIRSKQKSNSNEVHHPKEKTGQIQRILYGEKGLRILELFAGSGNLTGVYGEYGTVISFDKIHLKTGDSFLEFHRLIADKQKFDVVDLDPYGFPSRLFPDVYLLIESGYLFVTMPKPYCNILNGLTQTHLIAYYGEPNPTEVTIIKRIALWGLCHWRKVELIDSMDYSSVWRFVFRVERVKATEYTGVVNQPKQHIEQGQVDLGKVNCPLPNGLTQQNAF